MKKVFILLLGAGILFSCTNLGKKPTETDEYKQLQAERDSLAAVLKTSDANQINEQAVKQGMITLQQDGIHKVLAGITTTEEVLRVTRSLARKEDIVQET